MASGAERAITFLRLPSAVAGAVIALGPIVGWLSSEDVLDAAYEGVQIAGGVYAVGLVCNLVIGIARQKNRSVATRARKAIVLVIFIGGGTAALIAQWDDRDEVLWFVVGAVACLSLTLIAVGRAGQWYERRQDAKWRRCLDCLEKLPRQARVCRYCGYRFAPKLPMPDAAMRDGANSSEREHAAHAPPTTAPD